MIYTNENWKPPVTYCEPNKVEVQRMNKQEAIKYLEQHKYPDTCGQKSLEESNEAIDMAIEALYKPTSDDLIIKGAKGIQDGLYNIQNGELFQYKAKGGTVRAYPIVEALPEPYKGGDDNG